MDPKPPRNTLTQPHAHERLLPCSTPTWLLRTPTLCSQGRSERSLDGPRKIHFSNLRVAYSLEWFRSTSDGQREHINTYMFTLWHMCCMHLALYIYIVAPCTHIRVEPHIKALSYCTLFYHYYRLTHHCHHFHCHSNKSDGVILSSLVGPIVRHPKEENQ
jgi:hypothetical protein